MNGTPHGPGHDGVMGPVLRCVELHAGGGTVTLRDPDTILHFGKVHESKRRKQQLMQDIKVAATAGDTATVLNMGKELQEVQDELDLLLEISDTF